MAEFRLSNFTSGAVLTAAELNTGLTYAAYTPTVTQGVAVTSTTNFARYTKFGKFVHVSNQVTCTSSGTTNSKIIINLPVNASSNNFIMGNASINETACFALYDSSSGIALSLSLDGPSSIRNDGVRQGNSASTVTQVINGTVIRFNLTYEAA